MIYKTLYKKDSATLTPQSNWRLVVLLLLKSQFDKIIKASLWLSVVIYDADIP